MAFSQESLDFLIDNYFYNSREWYREHKEAYQRSVFEPIAQLITDLTPKMLEIDSEFVTAPKTGKTISRMYRDIRRVRDGMLFHKNVWCVFSRDKRLYETGAPSFYFQLEQNGFSYGCGFYCAASEKLIQMRQMILNGDKLFKKAIRAYEEQDVFVLCGDTYKRSKFPDQPKRLQNFLDRKNLFFEKQSQDTEILFSENLSEFLWNDFKKLAPIYDFLLAFA